MRLRIHMCVFIAKMSDEDVVLMCETTHAASDRKPKIIYSVTARPGPLLANIVMFLTLQRVDANRKDSIDKTFEIAPPSP